MPKIHSYNLFDVKVYSALLSHTAIARTKLFNSSTYRPTWGNFLGEHPHNCSGNPANRFF